MPFLHHVAVLTRDLDRSIDFYQTNFGFELLERPPFAIPGAWLALDKNQLHVILYLEGTFRSRPIVDVNDGHFAVRVSDFEAGVARLVGNGFSEDLPDGDLKKLVIRRTGIAGFPQAYMIDPDWNIVEINARS